MLSQTHAPESGGSSRGPYEPLVIIHGGAGSITRAGLSPPLYDQYRKSLQSYLESTYAFLCSTQSANNPSTTSHSGPANAVDAVVHAISMLECDPLFNCSRGAVFTSAGTIELEASLAIASIDPSMSSSTSTLTPRHLPGQIKRSAAVSMLKHTKHPIQLAREVLHMADDQHEGDDLDVRDRDWRDPGRMHGHLSGDWVERWGSRRGLEQVGQEWFWTKRRWEEHRRGMDKVHNDDEWQRALASIQRSENLEDVNTTYTEHLIGDEEHESSLSTHDLPSQGTVGCVCMDTWGNIAVGTSTGGLTNKRPGRIGDTPTVGAGFWAESWDEQFELPIESIIQDTNQNNHNIHSSKDETRPKSILHSLTKIAGQEARYWLSDCLPGLQHHAQQSESRFHHPPPRDAHSPPSSANTIGSSHQESLIEKKPLFYDHNTHHQPDPSIISSPYTVPIPPFISNPNTSSKSTTRHRHRAVAISGTGNGDSFLRTNATRTAAAISRFTGSSLAHGITSIAGLDGELQRSAGDRWGKTGEGEGGMIAIEVVATEVGEEMTSSAVAADGQEVNDFVSIGGGGMKVEAKVVFDFNCGGMWRAYFEEDENGMRKAKVMVFKEDY